MNAVYAQCTRLKICDGSTPWCSIEQQEVIRYLVSLAMKNELSVKVALLLLLTEKPSYSLVQ